MKQPITQLAKEKRKRYGGMARSGAAYFLVNRQKDFFFSVLKSRTSYVYSSSSPQAVITCAKDGFTLVELMVVISIIGILMALLTPAINAAREMSRKVECANNLRQFGIGFMAHAERSKGQLCSGAFDWLRDGAVTEVGWVADMVDQGMPVGNMICRSNQAQISAVYNDLLTADTSSFDTCVDRTGSTARTAPDGTPIVNPCRKIIDDGLAASSEERRLVAETEIYEKFYNTNYTASWLFVRGGPSLDKNGNFRSKSTSCSSDHLAVGSTTGPLRLDLIDLSHVPSSTVPLLADGAMSDTLAMPIGPVESFTPVAQPFTRGPALVLSPTLQPPSFSGGKPRNGPEGWWAVWDKKTLQDYRGFSPVHRGICNILMADGSVQSFVDANGDGFLNNGFPASKESGFSDGEIEIESFQVFSKSSLRKL